MARAKVRADFRIKFDGQLNQVDANTFINSLVNLSVLVQEINQEIDPDRTIDLKIVAMEPGSFIAGLNLHDVQTAISSLFRKDNIDYAAGIVTILGGVFTLKKFLGKDQPKTVKVEDNGSIKIENKKGSVQYFDNRTYTIYSHNQAVSDAISNSFTTLEEDPSVTGLEILDATEKEIFKVERDEFSDLSVKSEVINADKKAKIVTADLNLLKVVLERGRKWEFYYGGNRISATVEDEGFFDRIDRGEAFSKGDTLKVDLQINQVFDPSVNTFINHSFSVKKIIKHVPRGKQLTLDDISEQSTEDEADA